MNFEAQAEAYRLGYEKGQRDLGARHAAEMSTIAGNHTLAIQAARLDAARKVRDWTIKELTWERNNIWPDTAYGHRVRSAVYFLLGMLDDTDDAALLRILNSGNLEGGAYPPDEQEMSTTPADTVSRAPNPGQTHYVGDDCPNGHEISS